jgi:hypothetical protein
MNTEPNVSCEHEWALIHEKDTWSGPMRLSSCRSCRAILREWLPLTSGADKASR